MKRYLKTFGELACTSFWLVGSVAMTIIIAVSFARWLDDALGKPAGTVGFLAALVLLPAAAGAALIIITDRKGG